MKHNTGIGWTHMPGHTGETWNPLRGCSRVSAGCENCYAERMAARFSGAGRPYEGLAKMTKSGPRWTGKIMTVDAKLDTPLGWTKPRCIFVNSMSDLFHEDVPFSYIDKVFATMALTPRHIYIILTKRPERLLEYDQSRGQYDYEEIPDDWYDEAGLMARKHKIEWVEPTRPLPNVWVGVSCENQETADERIPLLLKYSCAVRFVSLEPILEYVDLDEYLLIEHPRDYGYTYEGVWDSDGQVASHKIGWVVVGGESGPGARPCEVEWIEQVRDDCMGTVPLFIKQLGARATLLDGKRLALKDRKGGDMEEWGRHLRVREWPATHKCERQGRYR